MTFQPSVFTLALTVSAAQNQFSLTRVALSTVSAKKAIPYQSASVSTAEQSSIWPLHGKRLLTLGPGINQKGQMKAAQRFIAVSAAALMVGLCGCQTTQYRYGTETFSSKEEALARQDQVNSDYLVGITPTKSPVHGAAAVVIPTIERIQKTAVKMWGNMTASQMRDRMDYVARAQEKNFEFMYRAVEKRQLFDKLSLVRSEAPEKASPEGYDYVIYLDNPSPDLAQWYLKKAGWSSARPIFTDMSKPVGAARTISWLDYLEEAARGAAPK